MPRTGGRGGPQTRARIAEVAAELFGRRGFDLVTVAEVAGAAGVSSVTVFNHFPRKEDLYLDRSVDAEQRLRTAVRERDTGGDVLTSLHEALLSLATDRHPLSGLDERSGLFFGTVAASPALVARARGIAADLQRTLTEELERDPGTRDGALLAAFVVAGYTTVLVATARQVLAGEPGAAVEADHRRRLDQLFVALRDGVVSHAPAS